MTVELDRAEHAAGDGAGAADRLGAALRAAGRCGWRPTVYVEFFRGIPVLLLLFFLYYGLPVIGEHYGLAIVAEALGRSRRPSSASA